MKAAEGMTQVKGVELMRGSETEEVKKKIQSSKCPKLRGQEEQGPLWGTGRRPL